MSRTPRIALIVLGSLAGLVVLLVVAALIVIQTPWFREQVRQRIVAEIEKSTGGRAEIGGFSLDLPHLSAQVRDFVLHGTEGPNEPPLFRAKSISVGAKIVSLLKRQVDIEYLGVDRPQAYVRVAADGSTNLPTPKVKTTSKKDPLQTVLDLAIRRFDIQNGSAQFAERKMPLNVRGEDLRSKFVYDPAARRYTGTIAITPMFIESGRRPALPVNVNLALAIESNRIQLTSGRLESPRSHIDLAGAVTDPTKSPDSTLQLNAVLSPPELANTLGGSAAADLRRAPEIRIRAAAGMRGQEVTLRNLRAEMGSSRLDASGLLSDVKEMRGSVLFDGRVALAEVGRILRLSSKPQGTVLLAGNAKLNGTQNYDVTGKIQAQNAGFQMGQTGLQNVQAVAEVSARPDLVNVQGLHVAALGGTLDGQGSLRGKETFDFNGHIAGFELRRLARQYGGRNLAWDGTLSGDLRASGTTKAPRASADLRIAPGTQAIPLAGRIQADYESASETIRLGQSYLQLPNTRLDLTGTVGQQLNIRLASRNLDDFLPVLALTSSNPPQQLPIKLDNGSAGFDGTVTGPLKDPRIAGHIALTSFAVNQQHVDRFAADLNAAKDGAGVRNATLAQGPLRAQVEGSVGLVDWKPQDNSPLQASLQIQGAQIEQLLAMANKKGMPVSGVLNAQAQASGTVGDPKANLNLNVTNGNAYEQPIDKLAVQVNYDARSLELTSAQLVSGPAKLEASGAFQHPPKDFQSGQMHFHLASNEIDLAQMKAVQLRRPGVGGVLLLKADGAGTLRGPNEPGSRILFSNLNANLAAQNLAYQGQQLGNLTANAETRGQDLVFGLRSNLVESDIRGDGRWRLAGDYPLDARLSFSSDRLGAIRDLVSPREPGGASFEGAIQGDLNVSGPVTRPEDLKGALHVNKLQVTAERGALPGQQAARLQIHNDQPIVVEMANSVIQVRSARLSGPATDLSLTGAVRLNQANALDLRAQANIGLQVVETFSPNIFAAGNVQLNAAVTGSTSKPAVNGRLTLKNASLNMTDVPNGLTNANGTVLFNGTQALIQEITGQTGGGQIRLTGMVGYGGPEPTFRLHTEAKEIRVRYASSISAKLTAGLDLEGDVKRSVLRGNVRILEVGFYSHTDFGAMLSSAPTPTAAPTENPGMLGGMRLDIRVATDPDVQFQTALTQNLEASAQLRVRGTASRPAVLGQVNVIQGQIVFFGNKYTVNRGTVSFFNPQRVEPVLDVDLETQVQGITVDISATGPMQNMKLAYRSDPPLQFSDIVALLATGKMPTTDPVLAANQPVAPQQSLEQKGASALLGEAVANPVSGRLQRLFGVTRLKIDPQIVGNENTPQAKMTLQQQINRELTFTYIQDVRESNPQVIRIEWAVNPAWSVVAVRDVNGEFGLDFFYKKRFR